MTITDAQLSKLPAHRSYSQVTGWKTCSEQYWLSRVDKVPNRPGWGAVGGKAVHTATEMIDLGKHHYSDAKGAFEAALKQAIREEEKLSGFEAAQFHIGGRATKEWPNKEDRRWWEANGPAQVESWVRFLEGGWSIFEIGGQPAVELDVSASLGDLSIPNSSIPVKGYVDRLLVSPDGELTVVDLKSGSMTPQSSIQLGVYAVLLEKTVGVRPSVGAFFMTRKGVLTAPSRLDAYTADRVEVMFRATDQAIRSGLHFPSPSALCSACGVKEHCWAVSGDD
jgi:CRISPR/Cas system-associated exonuclease Cas4 (RecB family)